MVRQAAIQAGRNPDEIRFIVFAGSVIGATEREALDQRRVLDDLIDLRGPLSRLAALLGLPEIPGRPDEAFTPAQLAAIREHPRNPRAARVAQLAKAGWSPRDILAHAVFDPYPSVVGTADHVADHLQ